MQNNISKKYDCMLVDKKLSDLNPLVFGYEKCNPEHSHTALRNHYLIHYVVSGKGEVEYRGNKYSIGKNQAFLVKPDDLLYYKADKNEPWHYIWIGFNGRLALKFDELESPVIDIETELFSEMCAAFSLLSTAEEFLAGKLYLYYSLIFDENKKSDYISSIVSYIDTHYSYPDCTVGKIAEFIGLEKHYMSRIFKLKTGKTVKGYIIEKRMKNSRQLLEKGYDVKTVAELSGFSDQFAFSKAFKNFYGISPIKIKMDTNSFVTNI